MKYAWHMLVVVGLLALLACTAQNHAGVTSTGNAGEIAGTVYDGVGVTMARQAMQAAAPQPADSAKVVLLNAAGSIVDSQRTNRDGGFLFRELDVGAYTVYAVFKQDTARLSSVQLTATQGYQALMTIGGQSGPAPKGASAVSLYSTEAGQVEQSFLLDYNYDSTHQQVKVTRRIGKTDSLGIWSVSFQAVEMILRDTTQSSCTTGGHFFSTLPSQVQANNWFYNGDLRVDYIDASNLCGSPLPELQEMRTLNMGGLEMLFDSTQVRAKFYQSNWCLNSSTTFPSVYASFVTLGALDTIDCNSIRAVNSTDTVVVRTLWYDPSAIAASLELTHRGSICIYTGLLAEQKSSKCSVEGLLK